MHVLVHGLSRGARGGERGQRRNISIFPGRNQKKCFQGGKGANAPPFCDHFHEQKRGWGFEPHKYLFLQRNLITNAPENADKRRATKKRCNILSTVTCNTGHPYHRSRINGVGHACHRCHLDLALRPASVVLVPPAPIPPASSSHPSTSTPTTRTSWHPSRLVTSRH